MIKNIEEVSCAFLHDLDLLCFSHLRWGFVFQRPQHLLTRFARHQRVFFVEEPVFQDGAERMHIERPEKGLFIVTPHLPHGLSETEVHQRLGKLVSALITDMKIDRYIAWYYTPMMLEFTTHLQPEVTVYDCMDELSAFAFAPPRLKELEANLFTAADVVFTGGYSIYESKKDKHANVHPFPSSIDKHHFGQARKIRRDPQDQAHIPGPRFGFAGVIDERMDIELIRQVAEQRPEWQFVIIGPVVKIDPAHLPRLNNIHYLGPKKYDELPSYIAGWDIAIIPFAMNESTKYISPTKTPEYLAGGKPVISTPIRDVVSPYGNEGLVHIAATAEEFIAAAEKELANKKRRSWLRRVDRFLSGNSWDRTWSSMVRLIEEVVTPSTSQKTTTVKEQQYV